MARAGAARVFFDVVGTFQASKLINDTKSAATVQSAIMADAAANIADSFDEMAQGVLEAVAEITQAFFDFDTQMIRVKKFYGGMEGEALRFADSAIALGEAFAYTGEEALAASARTAQLKQVLESQEAIIEATRGGLLMAAVGEMETEMGMNRLIALAQQTGFMMGNLTKAQYDALNAEQQANLVRGNTLRVLDQLNTVENTSVATMEDITFVLNQFASQANIAGESIGEMAAMSALLLETGEEVSRAGTGLRMIYQRIGNENTDAVKTLQELMGGVDASVITQMKLSDILKEIAPSYANMTAEQKRNLAVSIAGSRHYVKFLKLMENQERLVELQASAYAGAYGALDEFSNRAESAVFDMQQLQAMTQNVRVEIGENLAPAYLEAEAATYHFLTAVRDLSDTDFGLDVMTNVIRISGLYQNLIAPFANVGFQVFNMVIAFRTLGAVQRAMSAEAVNQRNIFIENARQNKISALTHNEMSANYQISMDANTMRTRVYRDELIKTMGMTRSYRNELTGLVQAQQNNTITVKAMQQQQVQFGATGSYQAMIHQRTGEMIYFEQQALTDLSARLQQSGSVIALVGGHYANYNAQMQMYRSLNQQSVQGTATFNALLAGGIPALQQRVQAQRDLVNARQEEFAIMNQEMQILIPLTEAERAQAISQIQYNNNLINESRVKLGIIRSDILRAQINGDVVNPTLLELVATEEKYIASLQKENIEMERGIQASAQADVANKKNIASTTQATVGLRAKSIAALQASGSAIRLGFSVQSVNRALMPLTMILPFVVDSSKSMHFMMAGMAAMMIMKVVPALFAKTAALKAMNIQQAAAIALQGAFTMGASLVGAGLALVAGYMLVKPFVGNDFLSSPLDNLNEFNDGLDTMESSLSAIVANEEAFLSGIVDYSAADLIKNPDLIASSIGAINEELDALGSVSGTGTDAFNSDIQSRIDAATKAKDAINVLSDSIEHQANIDARIASGMPASEYQGFRSETSAVGIDFGRMVGRPSEVDIVLYTTEAEKHRVAHMNMMGNIVHEEFETLSEARERQRELEKQYGLEVLKEQKRFYDAMLFVQEDYQEEASQSMEEANAQTLGDMFNFANAREELFFGQRQNFTGALYKQVSQGGIENLLHKTEIIQTNVFNGMTLPEMVSQVADGVVAELTNRGVSV